MNDWTCKVRFWVRVSIRVRVKDRVGLELALGSVTAFRQCSAKTEETHRNANWPAWSEYKTRVTHLLTQNPEWEQIYSQLTRFVQKRPFLVKNHWPPSWSEGGSLTLALASTFGTQAVHFSLAPATVTLPWEWPIEKYLNCSMLAGPDYLAHQQTYWPAT